MPIAEAEPADAASKEKSEVDAWMEAERAKLVWLVKADPERLKQVFDPKYAARKRKE